MVSLIQSNFASFGSGDRRRRHRIPASESRRAVHARSRASERARAAQAAAAHDHSRRSCGSGADAHRVRHHGRLESVAGARAVRLERRRSRDEHPGGARSAAIHEADVRGQRRERSSGAFPSSAARPRGKGHEVEVEGDFCSLMGGGQAVMRDGRRQLRRLRSAKDGAAVPEPVRRKTETESKRKEQTKRAGPDVSARPSLLASCLLFRFLVIAVLRSLYHLN